MSSRNESKAEKDRQKQIQEKCQTLLNEMLRDEDNKYCVDCDAKGPRWAAWNLGVFLCIRCAGIHRNLGVHISKVKSVNLDAWTPEQVISLQQMGNSRARAVYEATLPETYRRPQTDSLLESFIRAKYEHKKYIAKEWVQPALPKADWDKELDEEAERQRRKKKEKQAMSSLPPIKKLPGNVKVPALPKPTSSPKSSRASSTSAEESKQSHSVDLLGLNSSVTASSNGNGDDVFSSFLSAPVAQPSAAQVAPTAAVAPAADPLDSKGRTAEEQSFFNQSAPNSEPKKPLSKDSILALYSTQSGAPPQPTMFHAQGMFPVNPSMAFPTAAPVAGMFPVASSGGYPAPNPGGFPPPAVGGFPIASPFVNSLAGQPQPVAAAVPQANANPFFGMSLGMMPPQGFPIQNSLVQHDSKTSKPSDDLLADFGAPSTNLSQQMTGLSLGQPVAATGQPNFAAMPVAGFPGMPANFVNPPNQPSMGQTFTTNLWQ